MTFKKYLLLLLCLPCFVQAKNITISRLTCEMQEGLVVVESCPRLGWAMESPENGTRQTAYEIEIRRLLPDVPSGIVERLLLHRVSWFRLKERIYV